MVIPIIIKKSLNLNRDFAQTVLVQTLLRYKKYENPTGTIYAMHIEELYNNKLFGYIDTDLGKVSFNFRLSDKSKDLEDYAIKYQDLNPSDNTGIA